MAHLAIVYGTRPEWLKLAPVVRALERRGHRATCIHTGQHVELLPADARCDVDMQSARPEAGTDPEWYAGKLINELREWLIRHAVDAVVVQGDTASAYAGAVAGSDLGFRVVHVEAGVRSGDARDPDPEERFRREIDARASIHFPPTFKQRKNLVDEGLMGRPGSGPVVGNTVVDALVSMGYGVPLHYRHPRVMVTLHRREARGPGFREIVAGVVEAAHQHPEIGFLWPTHPNGWAVAELEPGPPRNLVRIPPITHEAFLELLSTSWAVVTDSGGVQEEAAVLGVFGVIARRITDRPETVDAGYAVVTGFDRALVQDTIDAALHRPMEVIGYRGYGSGDAAALIADHLTEVLA